MSNRPSGHFQGLGLEKQAGAHGMVDKHLKHGVPKNRCLGPGRERFPGEASIPPVGGIGVIGGVGYTQPVCSVCSALRTRPNYSLCKASFLMILPASLNAGSPWGEGVPSVPADYRTR